MPVVKSPRVRGKRGCRIPSLLKSSYIIPLNTERLFNDSNNIVVLIIKFVQSINIFIVTF